MWYKICIIREICCVSQSWGYVNQHVWPTASTRINACRTIICYREKKCLCRATGHIWNCKYWISECTTQLGIYIYYCCVGCKGPKREWALAELTIRRIYIIDN